MNSFTKNFCLFLIWCNCVLLYARKPSQKNKRILPFLFEEFLDKPKKEKASCLPKYSLNILPTPVLKKIYAYVMTDEDMGVKNTRTLSCVSHACHSYIQELKTTLIKDEKQKKLKEKVSDRNNPSLHLAACKDKYPILDLLIQQVGNLNKRDSKKNTPLHVALAHGCNVNAAKLAVNPKVDIGLQNQDGDTPLHLAVKNHKINIANVMLLLKHGASLDVKNNEGKTPLDVAFGQKLELLERKKAKKLKEMFLQTLARGKEIVPPLHFAVQHNNAWWVNQLIDEGAHLGLTDASGKTSLHVAVEKNHVKIFQLLLERGGSLNVKDKKGNSLLYTAVLYNRLPIARYLIKKGAQIDEKNNNDVTSLHHAVLRRKRGMIDLLINNGASLGARNKRGWTPLHVAARKNFTELIPLLVGENNIYIDAEDSNRATPLHVAASGLSEEAVQMLLQRGATVNHQDHEGSTPLMHLIRWNFHRYRIDAEKILRIAQELCSHGARCHDSLIFNFFIYTPDFSLLSLLLANGANINAKNVGEGKTLLHKAAHEDKHPLVDFLWRHGAQINVRDNKGWTPLHYAANRAHRFTVELLLIYGANKHAL